MGGSSTEVTARSPTASAQLRLWVIIGLLVALSVLVWVTFLASDNGADASSIQQGIGLAVTIAAVPVALLLRPAEPWRGVALGGAMALAGLTTTFGGNLIGLLTAAAGIPILLAGASRQPALAAGLVARLVGYAFLLAVAMWLSLGESRLLQTMGTIVLAAIVSTSPFWDRPSRTESYIDPR